jgi:hypothetical protein
MEDSQVWNHIGISAILSVVLSTIVTVISGCGARTTQLMTALSVMIGTIAIALKFRRENPLIILFVQVIFVMLVLWMASLIYF